MLYRYAWNEDPKKALQPMISKRGYYLNLYSDDLPYDARWCEVTLLRGFFTPPLYVWNDIGSL
jgi:hypothetical protein